MSAIEILSLVGISAKDADAIRAMDDRIALTVAGGWFDGEFRETWPDFTSQRYLHPDAKGNGSRDERDAMLAKAEIVVAGFPFPLDLVARAPKLKWMHQTPAGASNLKRGDIWSTDVVVTTSRGLGNTLAIAEYTVGCILHFAKGLNRVEVDRANRRFDHRAYAPVQLAGKTVCVVGAGGIGQDVGRLCAALGMRVIGTRRSAGTPLPGFEKIGGMADLHAQLGEADFVAVCCQWTPETEKMMNKAAFTAMKPGAVMVNVARGEIIDEAALVDALDAGSLRGVALDVYVGEFEHAPMERLWSDPRVLITPHTSASADESAGRQIALFQRNLAAYLKDEALENVLDWELGY